MESRFAHLRQRDSTVDMLRVKMSRRRSQSQKENRHRALNSRRQLDRLPELESSTLEASVMANPSSVQERAQNVKRSAVEERVKMLARYKEAKELVKEKAKREKERKAVFKVGLYHPPQVFQVPAAMSKTKAPVTAAGQSTRVTRSMRQQPVQNKIQAPPTERAAAAAAAARKAAPAVARTTRSRATAVKAPPLAPTTSRTRVAIVEPLPRTPSTRSARLHQAAEASAMENQPAAEACASRTRSNKKQSAAPPSGREMDTQESGEAERTACPPSPTPSGEDEKMAEDPAPADTHPPLTQASVPDLAPPTQAPPPDLAPPTQAPPPDPAPALPSSFAPRDFVFQAPVGLPSFKPTPLTPRTADAFLTPSISFPLPPAPLFPLDEPEAGPGAPSPSTSPPRSPCCPSPPSMAPPLSPQEPQHDVAYFRSAMVSETDRLTGLSKQWDPRVDDPSIPEEMRDRMRTVVGQARLLMKERFGQFRGLVDDCELGRGEKLTTCTDLQGFWEMVFFQVEDVNRKFAALKEAETRGWEEEQVKPPPRQRKGVKKPAAVAAASKPGGGPGTNAAAKSRLAAIKAAMKAKQQAAEAEKAAQATGSAAEDPAPQDPERAQSLASDTVVFNGGFFRVESPAKFPGPMRRSSRVLPLPSPGPGSSLSTPARTRRSNAASPRALPLLARTPTRLTPAGLRFSLACTPQPTPPPRSQACTPQSSVPLYLSPVTEAQVDRDSQSETVSEQDGVSTNPPEPGRVWEDAEDPDGPDPLAVPVRSAPSTPARQGRAPSPEACDTSMSLTTSLYPSLPLSPPSHGPEPSSPARSPALRFSLSPCPPHAAPPPPLSSPSLRSSSSPPAIQLSPPALLRSPGACDSSLFDAEVPMTVTPDTSISDGVQDLDFERYLQPVARCSLSPRGTIATETLSPAAPDVEMESPVAEGGGATREGRMTPTATAFPCVAQMFTPGTPQAAESDLLFFSPHPRDRIRQSLCPQDLMSFTPPLSKR